MPLYDFECLECGKEFEQSSRIDERKEVRCECGGSTKVLISIARAEHWFHPFITDNFNGEAIEVKSVGHLKELCLRNGVTSRALGDFRDYTHRDVWKEGL